MATRQRVLSDRALIALAGITVDGNVVRLPANLDRDVYVEANGALENLGGKWNKSKAVRGHEFTEEDGELRALIFDLVDTGSYERNADDYFPTPVWLLNRMVSTASINPTERVLEPSAGDGGIASRMLDMVPSGFLLAVEIDNKRATKLSDRLKHKVAELQMPSSMVRVMCADFLNLEPPQDEVNLYDRIVMNPPFSQGRGAHHVRHAMRFLKPGGRLVAIMPVSLMQRNDVSYSQLRRKIMTNGTIMTLAPDAFKDAGTMVRSCMVVWDKPAGSKRVAPDVAPQQSRQTTLPRPTRREMVEVAPSTGVASQVAPEPVKSRFKRLGK